MLETNSLNVWLLVAVAAAVGKNSGKPASACDVRWALDGLTGESSAGQTAPRLSNLCTRGYVQRHEIALPLKHGGMSQPKPRYTLSDVGAAAVAQWARQVAHEALWREANGYPPLMPVPRGV